MGLDPDPTLTEPAATVAALRDPKALLEATLKGWSPQEDLWVFGYASLIWRPTVKSGLSEVIGSWKIMEMSLPRTLSIPL